MLQKMVNYFNNEYICWQWGKVFIIILAVMNLSGNNSEKQKGDSQQIKSHPIIVLDSSENQQQKEMQIEKGQFYEDNEPIMLYEVKRKQETPEQKEKRMASIQQEIRDGLEKSKYFQMPTQIPRVPKVPKPPKVLTEQQKRHKAEMKRMAQLLRLQKEREQRIRSYFRQFNGLPHIPIHILELVRSQLNLCDLHVENKIDNMENIPKAHARIRQEDRQKLITLVLIKIQELKQSTTQKNQTELMVCNLQDPIQYTLKLVREIDNLFYKKLFEKSSYRSQIRIVLNQLCDEDNIEFQRKIITQTYPLNDLAISSEEDMMCEKGRRKLLQERMQFVRMFQKQSPEDFLIKTQTDRLYEQKERLNQEPPEEKKESPEEGLRKNKEELITKNKKICKTIYKSMIKSIKEMNERAQHLRSKGFDEVKDFSFAFDVEN